MVFLMPQPLHGTFRERIIADRRKSSIEKRASTLRAFLSVSYAAKLPQNSRFAKKRIFLPLAD